MISVTGRQPHDRVKLRSTNSPPVRAPAPRAARFDRDGYRIGRRSGASFRSTLFHTPTEALEEVDLRSGQSHSNHVENCGEILTIHSLRATSLFKSFAPAGKITASLLGT